MKRLIVAIGVALLAGACGQEGGSLGSIGDGSGTPRPSATPPATESPQPTESPTTPPTSPSPGGQTFTYEVWWGNAEGRLFVSRRTEPFTEGVGRAALEGLLDGPNAAERAAGVSSAIPSGTELNGLNIEDAVATVDLSEEFEASGGSAAEMLRLAQVVFTITQFPTVDAVEFRIDGETVEVFGSHGIVLDEPQARGDYADLLPAILVESPVAGERVDNPVVVSGTANVFEATVSIRIRDASGEVIASTFTTATCGTGCRGDYSASVRYDVDAEQAGTIEVFESSAQDGRPLHLVSIPVTLTP